MSNSVFPSPGGRRTHAGLSDEAFALRQKKKTKKHQSSKIQFSREPSAASAVTNHVIRGERDPKGVFRAPATAAKSSKSRGEGAAKGRGRGSGSVHLRSSADFACKTRISGGCTPHYLYPQGLRSEFTEREDVLNNGGQPAVNDVLHMQQTDCTLAKHQRAENDGGFSLPRCLRTTVSGVRSGLAAILLPVGGLRLKRRVKIPRHPEGPQNLNSSVFDGDASLA